jgi:hypothetical protein
MPCCHFSSLRNTSVLGSHVTHTEKEKNVNRHFMEKPEGKNHFESLHVYMRTILNRILIVLGAVDWSRLLQHSNRWQAFVNTVLIIPFP